MYRKPLREDALIYKQINGTNKYNVFADGGEAVGSFSFHSESSPAGHCCFWIDEISITDFHCDYATMEAVLLFIQYKCQRAGCPSMHIRLDQKNMLCMEMCLRFGFYLIDREEVRQPHGQISGICVLKYILPTSGEEIGRDHLLRTYKRK